MLRPSEQRRHAQETMIDGFDIREAGEGDRDDIVRLVANMTVEDSAARYDWMYRSNPHGRAVTFLAFERQTGRAVGCASVFPRRMLVDGEERIGSIGGDAYIEPRVRRRGLATALHRASFAGMSRAGIAFMYGPPAPHNLSALIKAGSHLVTDFDQWALPLSLRAFRILPSVVGNLAYLRSCASALAAAPGAVLRGRHRARRSDVILRPVYGFGSEFDSFFARMAAGYRIIGVRDRTYLSWRYLGAPGRHQMPFVAWRGGDLVGFVALEISGGRASVIDLFTAADGEVIADVLRAAIDQASGFGASLISIGVTSGSPIRPEVRSQGFLKILSQGFQVALRGDDVQAGILLTPAAWHFMTGDTDMAETVKVTYQI